MIEIKCITTMEPDIKNAAKINIEGISLPESLVKKVEGFQEENHIVVFYYTENSIFYQIGKVAENLSPEESLRKIVDATLERGEHFSCPPLFKLDKERRVTSIHDVLAIIADSIMNFF